MKQPRPSSETRKQELFELSGGGRQGGYLKPQPTMMRPPRVRKFGTLGARARFVWR